MLKKIYDWFNRRNERKHPRVNVAKLDNEVWEGDCLMRKDVCQFYTEGSEAQVRYDTTAHCLETGHVVRGRIRGLDL